MKAVRPAVQKANKGEGRRIFSILAASALGVMAPAGAFAQVIEIGDGGSVAVRDGAAVYTRDGVVPILRSETRRAHRRPATAAQVDRAADGAELSSALVAAVAWRESRMRAGAVSRAGAIGEMQLMPDTARSLGVDPRISGENLAGGANYLHILMRRYDGDLIKTLAAYNAGPKAVDRYGGVPPFKETQAYVADILDQMSRQAMDETPTGAER